MLPLRFGPADRPLLGYFHPSGLGGAARASVAICGPLGWEAIAAHFALRALADSLAAEGFDVLRFDYDGAGDSFGDDDEPDRVARWMGSVAAALDLLKAQSPGLSLTVVGIHLGATFAARVASKRADVTAAVLWATFAQGRAFVRQVKAYRALNPGTGSPVAAGDEEAAGFYLSAETVKALSALTLLDVPVPPAPLVLLLARQAGGGDEPLAEHWRRGGAETRTEALEGYADMMQEPRKSVVPTRVFDAIRGFLLEAFPTPSPRVLIPPPSVSGITETEGFFGPSQALFGILTRPPRPTRPTVVFLNTASDPRVGPNRMYVRWARALADAGHASFRFDPRGVGDCRSGDSPASVHVYSKTRLQDLRAVFEHLRALGMSGPFVLVGLCSGAFVGFHGALEEPGVCGIVMLNPQTFQWNEGDSLELKVRGSFKSTRFYRRALLEPETWRRALRGEVNVRGTVPTLAKRTLRSALRAVQSRLPFETSADVFVERGFRKLLQRGTRIFLLFGANDGGIDAVEAHLGGGGARMRSFPGLKFEVIEGPDHTFSQVSEQRKLYQRVAGFLQQL